LRKKWSQRTYSWISDLVEIGALVAVYILPALFFGAMSILCDSIIPSIIGSILCLVVSLVSGKLASNHIESSTKSSEPGVRIAIFVTFPAFVSFATLVGGLVVYLVFF